MERDIELVDSFSSHLSNLGLGLRRKTVRLDSYNPNWKTAFEWVSKALESTLVEIPCEIHHAGSTSVPGLSAKPILDLLLIFPSSNKQEEAISKLQEIGFVFKGDIIGEMDEEKIDFERHFYSYYDDKMEVDYVHLHSFTKGHPHLKQMIDFRDLMRKKTEVLKAYEALKQDLHTSGKTRKDYTVSKKSFIEEALKNF